MTNARDADASFADVGGTVGVFGSKATDYAVARPGYPEALYDQLELPGTRELTIADVGAGTGLLTAGLLARGHTVVAVEPNASMRAQADAVLGVQVRYRSAAGRAEDTGLASASVDLVTAAQAFHWFDAAAFRRECLRILRPHGRVALIWNDRADDPFNQALTGLFVEYGGTKRAAMVASNVKGENITQFFGGAIEAWSTTHTQVLDAAGLTALAFSRSFMPPAQSPAGEEARRAIDVLFAQYAVNGLVHLPYRTLLFLGRPV
jgi:SAM-dependent methyltransferase